MSEPERVVLTYLSHSDLPGRIGTRHIYRHAIRGDFDRIAHGPYTVRCGL